MNVHVEYGPEFKRQFKRLAKKYHSLKSDYESWLDEIYKNPLASSSFLPSNLASFTSCKALVKLSFT